MGKPNFIKVSNETETIVRAMQRKNFAYRYTYARSHDSQRENEPGQDILVFLEDGARLAFALCDGVSQSFYGDLAARSLADALLEWIWKQTEFETDSVRLSLASLLQKLIGPTQQKVVKYPLPTDISEMLRSVLEQKRNDVGSESMFIAGLIDSNKGEILFAWLGDSRLRIWDQNMREMTSLFGDSFHSHERWYSNKGVVGSLHVQILPISKVFHITAYSDGLACLDSFPNPNIPNQQIQTFVNSSGSDDDSLIQISMGLMPKEWGEKVKPLPILIIPRPTPLQPQPPLPPPPPPTPPIYHRRYCESRFYYFLVGLCLILLAAIFFLTVKIVTYYHQTPTPSATILSQETETKLPQATHIAPKNVKPTLTITPDQAQTSTPQLTPTIQKGP